MKSSWMRHLSLTVMAMLAAILAQAAEIKQVRVEVKDGREVLVVETGGKVLPKLDKAGDKLIVKVPGGTRTSKADIDLGGEYALKARFGAHPGEMWLVLELSKAANATMGASGVKGFRVDLGPSGKRQETEVANLESLAPVQAGLTYRVVDVSLSEQDGKAQLVISADGPANYKPGVSRDGKTLSILFRDSVLSWAAPEDGLSNAAIRSVKVKQESRDTRPEVRVELTLTQKLGYAIDREQNQVVVTVDAPELVEKESRKEPSLDALVSLNVENVDIIGVIKSLADQVGFEAQFTSAVNQMTLEQRAVSLKAENRPLREVLATVLTSLESVKLSFDHQGKALMIGTDNQLREKKRMMQQNASFYRPEQIKPAILLKLAEPLLLVDKSLIVDIKLSPKDVNEIQISGTDADNAKVIKMLRKLDRPSEGDDGGDGPGSGGSKTQVFRLKYLKQEDKALVTTSITQLINDAFEVMPGGAVPKDPPPSLTFSFDAPNHLLVVTGTMSSLRRIAKLLERIDTRKPQVRIEGRIIEVSEEDVKAMGIDLSAVLTDGTFQVLGPASKIFGRATIATKQGGVDINATIDAMVSKGSADILSSPQITVQDNEKATFESTDVFVTTTIRRDTTGSTISDTVTFTEKLVPLKLEVTPRISAADQAVEMLIAFLVENVTKEPANPLAPPQTSRQSTVTRVIVSNAETAVIGGMSRDSVTKSEDKVPILGDIPLLGLLFKRSLVVKNKKEVLIFITPTIVED